MKRSKWILAALAIGMVIPVISLADESTPGTAAPPPATTSPGHHEHASKPAKHVVDLNKGSKEDLMRLPGVDATTADKIEFTNFKVELTQAAK
jgi:DNA uptake protein ComE-like DNA-binding protein